MKRIAIILPIVLLLISIPACSFVNNSQQTETQKETIRFDLTQYKDYGKLSDGIIWVIKEVSDWNAEPYDVYAYLDCDGNIIYGWNCIETYYNHNSYDCPATRLQDFKNGYALIYDQSRVDNLGGYAEATIIDKTGREVATFLIDAYESGNKVHMDYQHFNSDGYAFFIGKKDYDSQYGMYFVNSKGIHLFQCNKNSYISGNTMQNIEVVNQQYLYVSWANYQLFDLSGKMLIDFQECSEILPDSIEIIDDQYIEATFTGKDNNIYVCLLSARGDIIVSPVLKTQYTRENVLNSIGTADNIVEDKISSLSESVNCVKILDKSGNGIENVLVNMFYNDCVTQKRTDKNGMVDISNVGITNIADVSVSILSAPEGYKYDVDKKYYFDQTARLTIVLEYSA